MFYHDNMNGPMYENGQLSHNWDPDRDFPENSYISVHFRIDTKGFDCNGHFNNAIDKALFDQEAKAVLARFGIMEDCGFNAERAGIIEHLHIHPQDISGTVKQRDVKPIALALDGCTMLSVRWVDVYEEVFDMTEEAFLARLEGQKQTIKADLAAEYRTKRSNLYIIPSYFSGPEKRLEMKYHIPRTRCQGYQDGPCYSFLCDVREEMVMEELLVKTEIRGQAAYRTAKQPKTKREKKTA